MFSWPGEASPLPRRPQSPDPCAASAAPSDRAGQVRRCLQCSVCLAPGHWNPSFRPWTLPSAPRAPGAPSSRGQLWAPALGIRPGSAGGREERGGGEEGAGAGWAAGGIPGSTQTGPGAARCEMRFGAAGTAGRGRRQNLPRTLRASRARRSPRAPSARPSRGGYRDRSSLATSSGHFVLKETVCLSLEFDKVSGFFFLLFFHSFCSPIPLLLSLMWSSVSPVLSLGGALKPEWVEDWGSRRTAGICSGGQLWGPSCVPSIYSCIL